MNYLRYDIDLIHSYFFFTKITIKTNLEKIDPKIMMDEYVIKKNGYIRVMVGWMSGLVGGLQNHIPRLESGTDLYAICISFKN